MKYRDSAVIIYKDKFTDDIYCRLCSNEETIRNATRLLGDASDYICGDYVCLKNGRYMEPPIFDNTKHDIIFSITECHICPDCSISIEQCPHNVKKIAIDCMNSLDTYIRKKDTDDN